MAQGSADRAFHKKSAAGKNGHASFLLRAFSAASLHLQREVRLTCFPSACCAACFLLSWAACCATRPRPRSAFCPCCCAWTCRLLLLQLESPCDCSMRLPTKKHPDPRCRPKCLVDVALLFGYRFKPILQRVWRPFCRGPDRRSRCRKCCIRQPCQFSTFCCLLFEARNPYLRCRCRGSLPPI